MLRIKPALDLRTQTIVAYKLQILVIQRTAEFDRWLKGLRDLRGRAKILVRMDRLGEGNPGDVAPCGSGVSEMRIHFGPGYRVYFARRGERLILLLCGGDKSTQANDIRSAIRLLNEVETQDG